jgi:hypothetical protein
MRKKRELSYEVNENGCHICTSHKVGSRGYPKLNRDGKVYEVHRYIYAEKFGEIPEKLVVRHKCDNRMCINLDHLELGTYKENMNDMITRGRQVIPNREGENNSNNKLTADQVRDIRSDTSSTNVALAKKYDVTHQLISLIRKGRIWSDIN